jgi:hypothetical protein
MQEVHPSSHKTGIRPDLSIPETVVDVAVPAGSDGRGDCGNFHALAEKPFRAQPATVFPYNLIGDFLTKQSGSALIDAEPMDRQQCRRAQEQVAVSGFGPNTPGAGENLEE